MNAPTERERAWLDEKLAEYNSPIEIGHMGDHLGIADAMNLPHPSEAQVREKFDALTNDERDEAIHDFNVCPW